MNTFKAALTIVLHELPFQMIKQSQKNSEASFTTFQKLDSNKQKDFESFMEKWYHIAINDIIQASLTECIYIYIYIYIFKKPF